MCRLIARSAKRNKTHLGSVAAELEEVAPSSGPIETLPIRQREWTVGGQGRNEVLAGVVERRRANLMSAREEQHVVRCCRVLAQQHIGLKCRPRPNGVEVNPQLRILGQFGGQSICQATKFLEAEMSQSILSGDFFDFMTGQLAGDVVLLFERRDLSQREPTQKPITVRAARVVGGQRHFENELGHEIVQVVESGFEQFDLIEHFLNPLVEVAVGEQLDLLDSRAVGQKWSHIFDMSQRQRLGAALDLIAIVG